MTLLSRLLSPARTLPSPWLLSSRRLRAFPRLPASRRVAPGLAVLAVAGLALAGCNSAPMSRSDQAAVSACRAEADRVDAQQNRYELSERSQRDSPLSSSGTIGITSAGLGQLYGRDVDIETCLRDRRSADRATQPAASGGFSPQMDPTVSNSAP